MEKTVSAQALRESEELHRITLLNMSDAVFITDDNGVFTFICPNVDVIFGHSHDDVRGMHRISRLLGRELIEPGELARRGEIQNIEHQIETKDGQHRCLLVHVKPVSIKGGTILYVCRDITDRKRSERALSRNEQRLTLAMEAANAGTWDWNVPTGEMSWSPEMGRILGGADHLPASFDAFLNHVHPLDRDRVARIVTDAMQEGASYETEFRVLSDNGERWVMAKGRGLRNGVPLRMLGVFVDFTERHRVEDELRDLSGRLIDAHEQERRRLARELHDDVGQRLALMAMDVGALRERLGGVPDDLRDALMRMASEITAIGSQLHAFSHDLHPARLEQIGLTASIRTICEEISAARGMTIDFSTGEVPDGLPLQIAVCLYRIVQEALHNVVKHSRSTRASVILSATPAAVTLRVLDEGIGFNPDDGRKGTLGLVSMRERARMMRGDFAVTSGTGKGTTIDVRVPLSPVRES
jgi:PAS domain S-box-containing protein